MHSGDHSELYLCLCSTVFMPLQGGSLSLAGAHRSPPRQRFLGLRAQRTGTVRPFYVLPSRPLSAGRGPAPGGGSAIPSWEVSLWL